MSEFHVQRLMAEPCPTLPRARHILEVELSGLDGVFRAATPVVRLMLSDGDSILTLSAYTGLDADVRKGRCACGYKTIRSLHGTRTDDDMASVPIYDREVTDN